MKVERNEPTFRTISIVLESREDLADLKDVLGCVQERYALISSQRRLVDHLLTLLPEED